MAESRLSGLFVVALGTHVLSSSARRAPRGKTSPSKQIRSTNLRSGKPVSRIVGFTRCLTPDLHSLVRGEMLLDALAALELCTAGQQEGEFKVGQSEISAAAAYTHS